MTISLNTPSWQPSATLNTLEARAKILQTIRHFFSERKVLEVETPLLSRYTVTDPHVIGIPALFITHETEQTLYLQTSPEYAMKKLLAAGSGPIFQICKAFRQGDWGRFHNPEFTMLEWYRPGFDHHALMDEMDELLQTILSVQKATRMTYAEVFHHFLQIDPHQAEIKELEACAKKHIHFEGELSGRNQWLDLLLTHCIEPHVGKENPFFLYDFPVSQAALAKIRTDENPPAASRFEVYFKGIELANGFHELQDAREQRKRFQKDLIYREQLGLAAVPIDEEFLAALQHGIPDCAGVALGVDRLVMLALSQQSVAEVMSFAFTPMVSGSIFKAR